MSSNPAPSPGHFFRRHDRFHGRFRGIFNLCLPISKDSLRRSCGPACLRLTRVRLNRVTNKLLVLQSVGDPGLVNARRRPALPPESGLADILICKHCKHHSTSKMSGEEFWLIWFPCILAAVFILLIYLVAKLFS